MKCDILIRNGRIIDPVRGADIYEDIYIDNGRIIKCQGRQGVEAELVIDAEGCFVLPGLIDFHTHLFNGGSDLGIIPDGVMLPNGVTTAVDAGSAGVSNYEAFSRNVISNSAVNIKSFLNVSTTGIATLQYHENVDPKYYNNKKIAMLCKKYKDEILGLKIRLSKEIVGDLGIEPLKETVRIAEELGCPVVVHVTNPPVKIPEIIKVLRKGDVIVHAFHETGYTIMDENGTILSGVKDGREKGVFFDVGAGRTQFSFKVARTAITGNFLPDIISTDVVSFSAYKRPVFALPYVMSMYLNLGISLHDVVKACTETPAKIMNMADEIGTLKPGACADVCIMNLIEHKTEFADPYGNKFTGKMLFKPQLTIKSGQIVYRQIDFY